jgi:hypothetical protein
MTVKELRENLILFHNDDDEIAYQIFTIEDVLNQCKGRGITITGDEASHVLNSMMDEWGELDDHIDICAEDSNLYN